ncbi:LLM class F420-dependent oxidoreductase [Sphingobium mellinum]|uniref:LLM class F420-dependent oxidoreductase n=1 Tax=Sphingobium mellinum TaxID=1387166 RepID=UPI0030EC905F
MKIAIGCTRMLGEDPTGADVITLAQRAEELGFSSFSLGDHIVMPTTFDASVYPAGSGDYLANSPWYDSFVLLAAVAGATRTIRLGTSVAVVPYRPPVPQAQAIATLDFMSGGRFWYGIGLGWMGEEFEALEVPMSERAGRTRETIEIMKQLWSGDPSPYQGRYFKFPGGRIHPKPVQKPYPPIIVGGDGMPAYKRIVELGDGFQFNFKTLPEFKEMLDQLGPMMKAAGRDLSTLTMQLASTEVDLVREHRSEFSEYEALGLQEIVLSPKCASPSEGLEQLERLARDFLD